MIEAKREGEIEVKTMGGREAEREGNRVRRGVGGRERDTEVGGETDRDRGEGKKRELIWGRRTQKGGKEGYLKGEKKWIK